MSRLYLGIDTSNYTTSAALADEHGIICNVRRILTVDSGERGLRQSDAIFAHIKNLPSVLAEIGAVSLTAVGCSAYPRDAKGSYMPCFLAGESTAAAIASLNGLSLYRFSHQAGHIAAARYSSGMPEEYERFFAFHVSGGTTELLYCAPEGVELLGGTLDLNAGQLVDRVGVMLGLRFPCGVELEKLAAVGTPPEKPRICVQAMHCNLSGVENKAAAMLAAGCSASDIAAYVLEYIALTISRMTESALAREPGLPVLYAGGVMSNALIRRHIQSRFRAYFAEPQFSCDNAAGIALLCRNEYERQ